MIKKRRILLTKEFWIDLMIKAVKTAAQSAVAVMTGVQTGLLKDVDFANILQVGGYAALFCIIWNISIADDSDVQPEPVALPEVVGSELSQPLVKE